MIHVADGGEILHLLFTQGFQITDDNSLFQILLQKSNVGDPCEADDTAHQFGDFFGDRGREMIAVEDFKFVIR